MLILFEVISSAIFEILDKLKEHEMTEYLANITILYVFILQVSRLFFPYEK